MFSKRQWRGVLSKQVTGSQLHLDCYSTHCAMLSEKGVQKEAFSPSVYQTSRLPQHWFWPVWYHQLPKSLYSNWKPLVFWLHLGCFSTLSVAGSLALVARSCTGRRLMSGSLKSYLFVCSLAGLFNFFSQAFVRVRPDCIVCRRLCSGSQRI